MRGLDRTEAMLGVVAHAVPQLGVDRGAVRRGARGRRAGDRRSDAAGRGRPRRSGPPTARCGRRSATASGFAAAAGRPDHRAAHVHRRPRQSRPRGRRGRGSAAPAPGTRASAAASTAPCPPGRRGPPPDRPRPSARPMTADRRKRHLKILELISTRAVRTQEELAEALAAEGWDVTQSSVSRDIAALRLIKVDGAYRRPTAVRGSRGPRRAPDRRRRADGRAGGRGAGRAPHAAGRGQPGGGRARPAGLARRGWHASPATTPSSSR